LKVIPSRIIIENEAAAAVDLPLQPHRHNYTSNRGIKKNMGNMDLLLHNSQ
jgi:hypothetical protein